MLAVQTDMMTNENGEARGATGLQSPPVPPVPAFYEKRSSVETTLSSLKDLTNCIPPEIQFTYHRSEHYLECRVEDCLFHINLFYATNTCLLEFQVRFGDRFTFTKARRTIIDAATRKGFVTRRSSTALTT